MNSLSTKIFFLLFICLSILAQPPIRTPKPPINPPAGSLPAVRDTCANFWTLAPAENGLRKLLVLPAQDATKWIDPNIQGAAPAQWDSIAANELGFIWLTQNKGQNKFLFDPRKPQSGAVEAAYSPTTVATQQQWEIVARMPASNHDLTAAVLQNKFYVAGGLTAEWGFPTRSHPFDELWELDTKKLAMARQPENSGVDEFIVRLPPLITKSGLLAVMSLKLTARAMPSRLCNFLILAQVRLRKEFQIQLRVRCQWL